MDYKLCKELKDNGFPQRKEWEEGWFYCNCCKEEHLFKDGPDEGTFVGTDYGHRWKDDGFITLPTLSELIEACGDDFEKLVHVFDGKRFVGFACNAELNWKDDGDLIDNYKTTSEAVARLWLELNTLSEA